METLELREELADARAAGDDRKVQAMAAAMRARVAAAMREVAAGLAAGDHSRVAAELVALRYYRRFMDEVAVHDDAQETTAGAKAAAAETRGP
jgi:hypothetical protein